MDRRDNGNAAFLWGSGSLVRVAASAPPPRVLRRATAAAPETIDDRRYQRLDLKLPILYRVVGAGKSRVPPSVRPYLLAQTRDVSPLGLCLTLEEVLAPGTILALEIHLPERREKFEALGRVVWSRPAQDGVHHMTGLQFVVVEARRVREELHARMELVMLEFEEEM